LASLEVRLSSDPESLDCGTAGELGRNTPRDSAHRGLA
jgi:hypothetical protein